MIEYRSIVFLSCIFGHALAQDITSSTTRSTSTTALPSSPTTEDPDPSIVRGERAQPGEIPYQAYLLELNEAGTPVSGCGGSLIRPNWVLTAAHCANMTGGSSMVRLGGTNINNMTYEQIADLRIVHEGWNPDTIENDVALLRLPEAINDIAPIDLAPADIGELVAQPVRASGFGFISSIGPASDDLLKANLVTISNTECMRTFPVGIYNSTLCVEPSDNGRYQSVCSGDSGGPLTVETTEGGRVIVGVASFVHGIFRCDFGVAQAFARVSSFNEWIEARISENAPM